MKQVVHVAIFVSGVVEADVVTPTDVKCELRHIHDDGSSYMHGDGDLSPSMYKLVQQTAGQLLLDAMSKVLEERINAISQDLTLAAASKGGDA